MAHNVSAAAAMSLNTDSYLSRNTNARRRQIEYVRLVAKLHTRRRWKAIKRATALTSAVKKAKQNHREVRTSFSGVSGEEELHVGKADDVEGGGEGGEGEGGEGGSRTRMVRNLGEGGLTVLGGTSVELGTPSDEGEGVDEEKLKSRQRRRGISMFLGKKSHSQEDIRSLASPLNIFGDVPPAPKNLDHIKEKTWARSCADMPKWAECMRAAKTLHNTLGKTLRRLATMSEEELEHETEVLEENPDSVLTPLKAPSGPHNFGSTPSEKGGRGEEKGRTAATVEKSENVARLRKVGAQSAQVLPTQSNAMTVHAQKSRPHARLSPHLEDERGKLKPIQEHKHKKGGKHSSSGKKKGGGNSENGGGSRSGGIEMVTLLSEKDKTGQELQPSGTKETLLIGRGHDGHRSSTDGSDNLHAHASNGKRSSNESSGRQDQSVQRRLSFDSRGVETKSTVDINTPHAIEEPAKSVQASTTLQVHDVEAGETASERVSPLHTFNASSSVLGPTKSRTQSEAALEVKPKLPLRQRIWMLMSVPESSVPARVINTTILMFIFISSISFILETVDSLKSDTSDLTFWLIETASIVVFTCEFILRVSTCPSYKGFFKSFSNLIDLVAIIPYYIELFTTAALGTSVYGGDGASSGLASTRILRVLRLARVFRILKLGKSFKRMQLVGKALTQAWDVISMLLFLIMLNIVLFSSIVYFAERGEYDADLQVYIRWETGKESPFSSIPQAMWWCIVTMTTIGYGDLAPVTPVGKSVASLLMVMSILMLALPIAVIGANFQSLWAKEREQGRKAAQEKFLYPRFQVLLNCITDHTEFLTELHRQSKNLSLDLDNMYISEIRKKVTQIGKLLYYEDIEELELLLEAARVTELRIEDAFKLKGVVAGKDFLALLHRVMAQHDELAAVTQRVQMTSAEITVTAQQIGELTKAHL